VSIQKQELRTVIWPLLNPDTESDAAAHSGYRIEFNSVAIDDEHIADNKVHATVMFSNVGALPCCTDARFYIRLSGSGVDCRRVYPLPLKAVDIKPGGSVSVTETLDTCGMPAGDYDVQAGLFCEGTNYPISFGVEGRISDGYYEGRLTLSLTGNDR
jgi:hypothetical protein